MVSIVTSRLLLREFRVEDFEGVHAYASDPNVVKYILWGPNTKEDTKAFIINALNQKTQNPRVCYELAVTIGGELIGGCNLTITDLEKGEGEIGYCLRSDMWRKGYGTEVASALIEFSLKSLKLNRVIAKCDKRNIASFKVMEKNGMNRVVIRRHDLKVHGEYRDTYIYAISVKEWCQRQPV
jgi:ribosomal-protein-alanine N-acetyltransferase